MVERGSLSLRNARNFNSGGIRDNWPPSRFLDASISVPEIGHSHLATMGTRSELFHAERIVKSQVGLQNPWSNYDFPPKHSRHPQKRPSIPQASAVSSVNLLHAQLQLPQHDGFHSDCRFGRNSNLCTTAQNGAAFWVWNSSSIVAGAFPWAQYPVSLRPLWRLRNQKPNVGTRCRPTSSSKPRTSYICMSSTLRGEIRGGCEGLREGRSGWEWDIATSSCVRYIQVPGYALGFPRSHGSIFWAGSRKQVAGNRLLYNLANVYITIKEYENHYKKNPPQIYKAKGAKGQTSNWERYRRNKSGRMKEIGNDKVRDYM